MNWYVKSQIQKESEILPDYGISEGIWSHISGTMENVVRLAGANRLEELSRLKWKTGGPIWREADETIPPEFLKILQDGDYGWYVEFEGNHGLVCYRAGYQPTENRMSIRFNPSLPLILSQRSYFGKGSVWVEQKSQYMHDLGRMRHSIRHEVTHLLRDAQTGHIKKYVDKMKREDSVYEHYKSRGHEELEFEIDAKIAALASLRNQLGAERFDKLTPGRIGEILPGYRFPSGGPFLAKWVKRLMREGLLTTGMKEAWNL